jgi:hypothetical protein
MKMKSILITRPDHDVVTHYLSVWYEDVLIEIRKKGLKVIDLGQKNVSKLNFEKYMKKQSPRLVFLNGHGSESLVTGYNNEPIVSDSNVDLLKNTITYALACKSAKKLGVLAVKKGCSSFLGYKDNFCIITRKHKNFNPEEDDFANYFKEPAITIPLSLIKGNNSFEALNRAKNKFKDKIREISLSDAKEEYKDIRRWLFWNMYNLELVGEENAKF